MLVLLCCCCRCGCNWRRNCWCEWLVRGAGSRIVFIIVVAAIVIFVVVIVVVDLLWLSLLLSIVGGGVVCVSGGWRVGEVSSVDSQSGGGRVAHPETRERPDPSRRQPARVRDRILGDFSSCDATQQQTDSE